MQTTTLLRDALKTLWRLMGMTRFSQTADEASSNKSAHIVPALNKLAPTVSLELQPSDCATSIIGSHWPNQPERPQVAPGLDVRSWADLGR
jgi:hypothetical protein